MRNRIGHSVHLLEKTLLLLGTSLMATKKKHVCCLGNNYLNMCSREKTCVMQKWVNTVQKMTVSDAKPTNDHAHNESHQPKREHDLINAPAFTASRRGNIHAEIITWDGNM